MGKNVRSDTPIVMGNVAPLHKTIVNLELQIQSQFRVIKELKEEVKEWKKKYQQRKAIDYGIAYGSDMRPVIDSWGQFTGMYHE